MAEGLVCPRNSGTWRWRDCSKGGAALKKVGTWAREDMEAFFGVQVHLDLWVKVKENWRDNAGLLNSFGFTEE